MTQQPQRVALYNDYNSLPPQQAAAAAQHPMLAPRLTEAMPAQPPPVQVQPQSKSYSAVAGRHPEMEPRADPGQFYYPAPLAPAPQQWSSSPVEQETTRTVSSATSHQYTQFQPQSIQTDQAAAQYDTTSPQMPPPITDWASITAQNYSNDLYPQVRNPFQQLYDLALNCNSQIRHKHPFKPQTIIIRNQMTNLVSRISLVNTSHPPSLRSCTSKTRPKITTMWSRMMK